MKRTRAAAEGGGLQLAGDDASSGAGLGRDDDGHVAVAGQFLKPVGGVDGLAQGGEGDVAAEADVAHDGAAARQADAVAQGQVGFLAEEGLARRRTSGLARESINKLLSAWRDAGVVALRGRTLTLVDAAALQEIAEREV